MVTGRPPFLGDDVVAVISQHINTPPVAPSWHNQAIPRALEALVMRLLSKAPEDRPESAAAVRQALAAVTPTTASAPASSASEVNPLDRLAGGVFVGREREMDELRAALEQALSGRGRLVLLVGEAGIGKTRTAEELVTFARLRKVQVLWGRCYEGDAAPAYWPWIQAIRSYIQDRDAKTLLAEMGSGASDLAQLFSEVRDRLPGLPAPPMLEPEQARFRLFDGVTTFLRNAGRTQPLMIVLDDLHWADRSSLLLLLFVARELRDARLLIVGTYRDSEVGRQHPLSQALGELTRGELAQRITLRGLGEHDVARFVEITAGIKPPAGLVQALYRETEGNPFFVNEIVRLLVSEGRLEKTPHGRSWSLDIPESVRDVIGRRLDRLSSDCNRILSIASVVGREFGLPALQPLSGLDEERLLDLLDEALRARVVIEMPATIGRFAFSHALVRETLASEITPARRARLHRRIGEVLEALQQGSHEVDVAEIAHHFFEAARAGGDVEKAVDYSVRAGERATALVAYDEAVTHYEQALQVLDCARPADEARRCALLLSLGEARDRSGNAPLAKEAFLAAADLARKLGATDLLARAALAFCGRWLGLVEVGKVDVQLIGLLEEALTALGNAESPLRARLLGRLATELYFVAGSEVRRDSLSRDAVELARRLGDPATVGEALRARHVAIWGPDNVEERLAISTEMTTAAERAGNREEVIAGSFWRLADLLEFGDVDQLAHESERFIARAKDSPFVFGKWALALHRTMRALLDGRFTEAEGAGARGTLHRAGTAPGNEHAGIRGADGDGVVPSGPAGRFRDDACPLAQQYPTIAALAWFIALAYATGGRLDAARGEFDRLAAQDFRDLPRDMFWLATMMLVVETCVAIGDAKRAAPALRTHSPVRPSQSRARIRRRLLGISGTAAREPRHAPRAMGRGGSTLRDGARAECASGRACVAGTHPAGVCGHAAGAWTAGR